MRLDGTDAVVCAGHIGTEGTAADGGAGGVGGDAVYFGLVVEAWREGGGYEGELARHGELDEVHCDAEVGSVEGAAALGI